MHLTDHQLDLPGIRDVPAAVGRVVRRAAILGDCPVDHVAICVQAANLEKYLEQSCRQLPAASSSSYSIGDPGSGMHIAEIRDPGAGIHVVLAAPSGSRGQLVDFLSTTGAEGLQHIGFAVSDVRSTVVALAAQGLRFVGGAEDPEQAIVEVREGDNWLRQAFTEPLFDGFFIEVVERKGIVEMRPGNIQALYTLKGASGHAAPLPA